MVCNNHGRNYQLGDPPCSLLLRDSRELLAKRDVQTRRKRFGVNRPQHPILSAG